MQTPALVHAIYFGLVRPMTAWRARRVVPTPPFDRLAYYQRVTTDALFCGVISAIVLVVVPAHPAFEPQVGRPTAGGLLMGLMICAVLSAVDVVSTRRRLADRSSFVDLQLPVSAHERTRWALLSLVTGIGEEVTWRWAQPVAILAFVGHAPVAVAASALAFGAGHLRSGPVWASATVGIALVQQALVLLVPGGLYLAMAVHVGQNLVVGLLTRRS